MNVFPPFYSVIIPTYNRKHFLQTAVSSVLGQTFEDFELILIDDGSRDETQEWVRQLQDRRLRYFYQNHHGVAHARNQGLAKSRGQYVAFLDSDDQWVEHKLQRTLEEMEKDPAVRIFHSQEVWYRQGRLLAQQDKHRKPSGFVYQRALPLCCISISTAVIHREVFDTIGRFDEDFTACEDYDFWLRATHRFEVKLIPENLTVKDGGRPDQLSASVWGLDRFRIKALVKMLRTGQLIGDDYGLTVQELYKKCRIFIKGAEKRGRTEDVLFYQALIGQYV